MSPTTGDGTGGDALKRLSSGLRRGVGVAVLACVGACSDADMRDLEDAVAEARATSPRLFGDDAPARGRGGVSGPSARQLSGRELGGLVADSTLMVEWYENGAVVALECGYLDPNGRYRGLQYEADADTYLPNSAAMSRGTWSTRDDRLCVRARGWGCFDAEWAYESLNLIYRNDVVAKALVYETSWEYGRRCGL
jgi:hypothetical protein